MPASDASAYLSCLGFSRSKVRWNSTFRLHVEAEGKEYVAQGDALLALQAHLPFSLRACFARAGGKVGLEAQSDPANSNNA